LKLQAPDCSGSEQEPDLSAAEVNGYETCGAIRRHGLDVAIIILTARGQERDVMLGLDLGADDDVTKWLRTGGLVARIKDAGPLVCFVGVPLCTARPSVCSAGAPLCDACIPA